MRVVEVFGPTIQGEGHTAGAPAVFVRLWGCNLACTWCDTPYAWDSRGVLGTVYDRAVESAELTVDEVVAGVLDLVPAERRFPWSVVITGGEPLVQSDAVVELAAELHAAGFLVEVETNGTRPVPEAWARAPWWLTLNVSPKLAHADTGQVDRERMREWARNPRAFLKFVAASVHDLDEIDALVGSCSVANAPTVMPEGRSAGAVIAGGLELVDQVVARGYRLSLRSHVLLWDDERGR